MEAIPDFDAMSCDFASPELAAGNVDSIPFHESPDNNGFEGNNVKQVEQNRVPELIILTIPSKKPHVASTLVAPNHMASLSLALTQGPFYLCTLKLWKDAGMYPPYLRVYKIDRAETAVYLTNLVQVVPCLPCRVRLLGNSRHFAVCHYKVA